MPKRSCKFTEDLQNKFPFLKKVCTGNQEEDDRVNCSHCNSEFSVAHGGRSDIKDHLQSSKHKKSLACAASSSKLTSFFKTENAETSAEIINSSLLDVPNMKINNDQLFHEVVLAKEYLQSNWEQWKQEETTRDVIISSEEKWLRLCGHFKENHIAHLIKIVEYALCLPGTSAPVERFNFL
ncbi:hypothetical protein AVEN_250343-1 [Araneus ventricosus]|uniref:HAT C-terminal dimerisation domain-containing protein n=1 Tax=Araneus ventricosus TaxID=182803 RepID=A0A4Y2JZ86_ARAVE|nr:hypothetical protein AVEN_250343-1 [Araneus ventricosus]